MRPTRFGGTAALVRGIALAALVAGLLGCAGMAAGDRDEAFQLQMLGYGNAIRWGEFHRADAYRKVAPGRPSTDFAALSDVRVTAYDVVQTTFAPDGRLAEVNARIDYYRESDPGVRHLTDRQVWEYDRQHQRWWLVGGLPRFH